MRKLGAAVIGSLIPFGLVLLPWGPLAAATGQSEDLLEIAARKIRAKDFAAGEELISRVLIKEPSSSKAYNLLGVCQSGTGEYEAARKAFEKAIELNPGFASARVNLGILLLGLHKDTEAIKEFKAALAVDPSILTRDPDSYMASNILGLCLMDDKKYVEALAAFKRAARMNPKYAPARANMGNALVALKRDNEALEEFLAATGIDPEDFVALYNIGLIYGRQGKFDGASNYLGKAHRLAPQVQAVTLALVGAEISSGKKQGAQALIGEWEKSGSLSSTARKDIALVWLENGEPGLAVDLVRRDPELSSLLYKTSFEKAKSQFENGRYQEAAGELEAVRCLQAPDAAFHNLLGSIYYALDDPRRASDEFQDAIKLQPADPDSYFKLGMVFLKHLTPKPAIYVYETALKMRPDVPKLWLGLGLSYFCAYQPEDAERALNKALALNPRYEIAYVLLGDVVEQSGRIDDALEDFEKAIAISPSSATAYYYYGKVATNRRDHLLEAVEKLRRAIALKPDFPEAHYELGKALTREGNMTEAITELKKSLQLDPSLAESHYQLGLIYGKLGNQSESAAQFRQFEQASKKQQNEDLIQGLEVQIEKP
jgi:Flp pilus assembly protein TadD